MSLTSASICTPSGLTRKAVGGAEGDVEVLVVEGDQTLGRNRRRGVVARRPLVRQRHHRGALPGRLVEGAVDLDRRGRRGDGEVIATGLLAEVELLRGGGKGETDGGRGDQTTHELSHGKDPPSTECGAEVTEGRAGGRAAHPDRSITFNDEERTKNVSVHMT
jgi:hypothetical protein